MTVHLLSTSKADGDLNPDVVSATELVRRQRALVALPWTWLDEVHGTDVAVVRYPGDQVGAVADAAVTRCPDAVLSVFVGDCAPVALWDESGSVVGVAHAGWRGLAAGVLQATVEAMRALGADEITAELGPHIHADRYEFGVDDLAPLVQRFGPSVAGRTEDGRAALDVAAGVAVALAEVEVSLRAVGPCTARHDQRYWSHRARGERGRQALAIWRTP